MFALRSLSRLPSSHGLWIVIWLSLAAHLTAQIPEENADIRGPKSLVEIPIPQKSPQALWVGLGAGIAGVLVTVLIWNRLATRKKAISPIEQALASLRELEQDREVMLANLFADRAAQTVREYIFARFGLAAPRRTTEEFLRDLSQNPTSPLKNESEPLHLFLETCDLAKFAGARLNDAQRKQLLDAARGFITAAVPLSPPRSAP